MNDKVITVTAAIIQRNSKILIAERGPSSFLAGKWEFPGGKVEEGEELRECLAREIQEELGVGIIVGAPFHDLLYDYGEKGKVRLNSFLCIIPDGEPNAGHSHSRLMWVKPEEMANFDFAPADIPIVKLLQTSV